MESSFADIQREEAKRLVKSWSIEIWSGDSANFKVANKLAAVYVEPYLAPCTSFVLGLLIFK